MSEIILNGFITIKGKYLQTLGYIIIFPILIPSLHFLLGYSLDELTFNPFSNDSFILDAFGIMFFILGIIICFYGISNLWFKGKGLPVSSLPSHDLVNTGIYGIVRHPIYTGFITLYLGFSLYIHSFWNCVLSTPLIIIFYKTYIDNIEEPSLIKQFGNNYNIYKQTVPGLFRFPFRRKLSTILDKLLSKLSKIINGQKIHSISNHKFLFPYGLFISIGIMSGLFSLTILLSSNHYSQKHIAILLTFVTLFSFLGIRLVWIVGTVVCRHESIKKVFGKVGFVSWGALLGVILSGVLFVMLTGSSFYEWLDYMFISLVLAHFWGRIGCAFYGCCYGKETESQTSICYNNPSLKAVRENLIDTSHLFPVQFISSFNGLIIFIITFLVWLNNPLPVGFPFVLICFLYSLVRLLEEFYRYQKKIIWNLLSASQIVSILLLIVCTGHLIYYLNEPQLVLHEIVLGNLHLELINSTNIIVVSIIGVISFLLFSYHRYEIGRWSKNKEKA
ncbi:MAG: prolipoprotein diacylglyceryl transferase family protein [Bacteroidota bacterium]